MTVAVCLATSAYGSIVEPQLFAYIPIDANVSLGGRSLAQELPVDIYVIYAPPASMRDEKRNMALELARSARQHGIKVFLVVGNEVDTTDPNVLFDQINGNISFFADDIDGLILWDDPIREGYMETRNTVARWVRGNWSQFQIGLALDPPSRNASLHAAYFTSLRELDTEPYDFVVTYYFCLVNTTGRYDPLISQGVDPGEIERLRGWVANISAISNEWNLSVWFTLAAHQEGNTSAPSYYTTTVSQMDQDLEVVKDAGFAAIGWFTMNLKCGETVFVGAPDAGKYSWSIYGYLRSVLLDSAKNQPTVNQVLAEILELQRNHMYLLTEFSNLADRVFVLENHTANQSSVIDNLSTTILGLQDDRDGLQRQIDGLNTDLATTLSRIADLEGDVRLLQRDQRVLMMALGVAGVLVVLALAVSRKSHR